MNVIGKTMWKTEGEGSSVANMMVILVFVDVSIVALTNMFERKERKKMKARK